ncbi:LOW QUALITY PROTEIN: mitochondrial ribosomal protein S34 [Augochlora pura]
MVIKYIGRTTTFKGKSLWEILGNLKNYGVGRMVVRSQHQRYPEPSYMRILKVAALPMVGETNPDNTRKVVVLVEKTFRGQTVAKPVQLDSVTYKTDYVLIPKDEESHYLNVSNQQTVKYMPSKTEFPPLLKEILIREAKQAELEYPEGEPKLRLRYNLRGVKNYKIAEDQETPTIDVEMSMRSTLYMDDYDKLEISCNNKFSKSFKLYILRTKLSKY